MAKRLGQAAPQKAKSAPPSGADDLSTMYPRGRLKIAGRQVTVREYGFMEGLDLQRTPEVTAVFTPLIAAARHDGGIEFEGILDVLADHRLEMTALIAQSIAPEDWQDDPAQVAELAKFVRKLGDADGQLLMLTWWSVNGGFFVRRVANTLAADRARAALKAKASAGRTSTNASADTTSSVASTSSESTPADS